MADMMWRTFQATDATAFAEFDSACLAVDGELIVPWKSFAALTSTPEIFTLGGFLPDGQLVAAGYMEPSNSQAVFKAKVHPEFRPQNLEKPLLTALQQHAQTCGNITEWVVRNEALDDYSERTYGELGYKLGFFEWRMRYPVGQPLAETPNTATFETWTADNSMDFFTTYAESFRERLKGHSVDADEWIADHTEDEDFRPDWSFLARIDGKPVGMATMFNWVDGTPRAYLSQIGTVPDVRGQGVSIALVNKVLACVEAAKIPYLDLHVNGDNARAIGVYEKMGFLTIGRRAKFSRTTDV